jgi:YfiH family protein
MTTEGGCLQRDVIFPEIFCGLPVKAFFTGKHTGSDPAVLSKASSIKQERIYLPIQKHTDRIIIIKEDTGSRIGDSVITVEKNMLIGIKTADCVPILLYDKSRQVAAAVHAGWRGTADSILKKTVRCLITEFLSAPSDILMAVGPAIRGCCYEVGHDVFELVKIATGRGDYYMTKDEKYRIDLQKANRQQALSAGLSADNIQIMEECTYCTQDKFFSYRFSKENAGRQGGFIAII